MQECKEFDQTALLRRLACARGRLPGCQGTRARIWQSADNALRERGEQETGEQEKVVLMQAHAVPFCARARFCALS